LAHPIYWGGAMPDPPFPPAATRAAPGGGAVWGGWVLAATGWGADLATARERAYAAVGQIRFSGQHFRRDIGHRALGKVVS